jgi:hypothetical protein
MNEQDMQCMCNAIEGMALTGTYHERWETRGKVEGDARCRQLDARKVVVPVLVSIQTLTHTHTILHDTAGETNNSREGLTKKSNEELIKRLLQVIESLKESHAVASQKQNAQNFAMNMFKTPSESDVMALNIRGTHLDVFRGTLTAVPGLLATIFNGNWDENLSMDSNGRFFLDEDPEIFIALVNYLRERSRMLPSGKKCPKLPYFSNDDTTERFVRMVSGYHLEQHLWPFNLVQHDYKTFSIVEDAMHSRVFQRENDCYYVLQRKGPDNRRVRSFTVQIYVDECEDLKVGWLQYSLDEATEQDIDKGIEIYLEFIDATVELLAMDHDGVSDLFLDVDFQNRKDPIIRCANYGAEWYIDGEQVAETGKHSSALLGLNPFISITGTSSFRLLEMELEYK